MRAPASLLIGFSAIVLAGAAAPAMADAAQTQSAAVLRQAAFRPLDLSVHGPSVAMQAAQAAQAGVRPGPAPATGAAPPAETATSAPAGTVSGLTVSPDVPRQGRIIASTDATSLASPNFTAADGEDSPQAIGIGGNAALGRQVVDNSPVPGGLAQQNPDILGAQPTRSDVGVTTVF